MTLRATYLVYAVQNIIARDRWSEDSNPPDVMDVISIDNLPGRKSLQLCVLFVIVVRQRICYLDMRS